ncbi:MAG: 2'-5' RNA ligase family protein [Sphingomonadaceae bacterium]|nr:2'-5' RNA ligase family protein [Sphingomonadaceae bacterium]
MDSAPFILSAELDARAHAYFERLRTELFPPERLLVGAHLTLFHLLPPSAEADVLNGCAAEARQTGPIAGEAGAPYSLGRGVAFRIAAPGLDALRARLVDRWGGLLSAQDQAPFRAHVTVMNKAEPKTARAALERLEAEHRPFPLRVTALALWRYRGGPWEAVKRFGLSGR